HQRDVCRNGGVFPGLVGGGAVVQLAGYLVFSLLLEHGVQDVAGDPRIGEQRPPRGAVVVGGADEFGEVAGGARGVEGRLVGGEVPVVLGVVVAGVEVVVEPDARGDGVDRGERVGVQGARTGGGQQCQQVGGLVVRDGDRLVDQVADRRAQRGLGLRVALPGL